MNDDEYIRNFGSLSRGTHGFGLAQDLTQLLSCPPEPGRSKSWYEKDFTLQVFRVSRFKYRWTLFLSSRALQRGRATGFRRAVKRVRDAASEWAEALE
jgi:hypothetical protein